MRSIKSDKKIKKELILLEKEEKIIEGDQKKLEQEERKLLSEMGRVEEEEKWHVDIQYNCKFKIMDANNVVNCHQTGKLCVMDLCPTWAEEKNKKK